MENEGDVPALSLGSIEVVEEIGHGGFGIIFKAKVKATKEVVALKRLKLYRGNGVYDDKKFSNECSVLQSLSHQNIVRFIGCFKNPMYGFIGMEYIRCDLERHVDMAVTLPMDEVKSIAKDILQGLGFCHANKVIHRDLKPSNVLLTSNGTAKLADFGLARDMGARPKSPMTMDVTTVFYKSPELIIGKGTYTYSTDLWSYACTFSEMVSGSVLFEARGDTGVLNSMFELLGTPTQADLSALGDTKLGPILIQMGPSTNLIVKVPRFGLHPLAEDMVKGILRYDPTLRPTADELLLHPFFA